MRIMTSIHTTAINHAAEPAALPEWLWGVVVLMFFAAVLLFSGAVLLVIQQARSGKQNN